VKSRTLLKFLAIASLSLWVSTFGFAASVNDRATVMQEISSIYANDPVLTQICTALTTQYIAGLKAKHPNLNEKAALKVVYPEVLRGISDLNAEIMIKHFSDAEITELLQFLKSPLGVKYRGMATVAEKELPSGLKRVLPEVQRRLDIAFEREGLLLGASRANPAVNTDAAR
jgi:hypothetical protein